MSAEGSVVADVYVTDGAVGAGSEPGYVADPGCGYGVAGWGSRTKADVAEISSNA